MTRTKVSRCRSKSSLFIAIVNSSDTPDCNSGCAGEDGGDGVVPGAGGNGNLGCVGGEGGEGVGPGVGGSGNSGCAGEEGGEGGVGLGPGVGGSVGAGGLGLKPPLVELPVDVECKDTLTLTCTQQ
mmetsp:Transcript_10704/g.16940  ORF Transcript_10704/g.16940 Transcript_10704/m.16940 type:complete len:126 (-) Transcript_10704:914-1291(-)